MNLRRALAFTLALAACVSARAGDHACEVATEQSAVTITSTTTTSGRLVQRFDKALFHVNVTAVSGTPTLDITLEVAPTDDGPWATHTTLTQITSTTSVVSRIENIGKWIRVKETVGGGSPSLTLSTYWTLCN